jgi:DNA-binding transcriptional MerR regulator/quercetin dioxygenase-like cupin family protein
MSYTVKQVAGISGVSVRTLHFYDEAGLLKPARYGENGYRFYDEPQLLLLQQILFYRELGFELKEIQRILSRAEFEKIAALKSHRVVLQKNIARTRRLIETIDKTIQHLKGRKKMKAEEMFVGFSVAAGKDRFGQRRELGGPGGEPTDCKVSSRDTKGAWAVFEFAGHSGGPRHLHYDQDEWIYVLEGEFEFHMGQKRERIRVGPGGSVFLPRKVPHVWACVSERPGKILDVYQPAGQMEKFFRELARPFKDLPTVEQVVKKSYTARQVKALHRFFDSYGMDLLGPPMGFE